MATGRYVKNKNLNAYIQELVAQGWTVEKNKHIKLRSPNGKLVVCSSTPNCPFVVHKVRNDVRRVLRDVK